MGWPPGSRNNLSTNHSFIFLAADEKADYWLLPILFVVPAETQEECLGQSPNQTSRTTRTCIWNHELWRHLDHSNRSPEVTRMYWPVWINTPDGRKRYHFEICIPKRFVKHSSGFLPTLASWEYSWRTMQLTTRLICQMSSRKTRSDAKVLNAISRGRECSRGTLQRSDQRNDPSRDSIWNKGVGLDSAISPLGNFGHIVKCPMPRRECHHTNWSMDDQLAGCWQCWRRRGPANRLSQEGCQHRQQNPYYNLRYNPSAPFIRSGFLVSYRIRSAMKFSQIVLHYILHTSRVYVIHIKSLSKILPTYSELNGWSKMAIYRGV